jgi:catechol 2,3-dioxygenase-like lactoylglutathione lyase family enzyme
MVPAMTDSIPIKGFNRVELIVREDQIDDAVRQFNEVLGLHLVTPHPIEGVPVLSATDFDGSIEFVAPLGGKGPFANRLARSGSGQIGPLVWEVADIDQTREWLSNSGYRIFYEYDSSQGNEFERATNVHQLVLDPDQWFGFSVTLMQRG